ncbi:DNA-directed RNA polymerase specialized sigma subunit [Desulfocucumis palustris]|uniref:DNA-directed RNA polymerase specialized sigma subunit n=1 Tax=Desulfocucumis palustris TaxID=1898651 RepID=A0A2L2XI06_9FIRM|nr:sigma-70 family RNA polymerase sigma factor [Desulfocucumis palustris]GBF35762.1 DNA-directed RNA polymerase specialized sigma subunit [Desulfocucumis palustris]
MGRVEPAAGPAPRDPAVFAEVFDQYMHRVYKYMRYRTGDRDEAEDLTSTVFEKALANMDSYNPERAGLDSWIFAIARNTLTDHRRRQGRRRDVSLDLAGELACTVNGPANQLIEKETRQELLQAVARLSDRERDIIGLKFAAGLANNAIAEMTGLTAGNVAVIIFRALKSLRSHLSAGGAGVFHE